MNNLNTINRNPAGGPNTLCLHKTEWNTLKNRSGPPEKPVQKENEYLKTLIEKSQAWIRTWPDTVQGCMAQKVKQREIKRAKEITAVKAFAKRKVHKNTDEAIQKAKQKIFDESCYGKKLLSALRESKALEERDAQVQFTKELKEKKSELDKKEQKTVKFCSFELDKDAKANEAHQKSITVQNSKENKEMYEKRKIDEAKQKEQEKMNDLENAQLMRKLLDREREAEEKIKLLEKEALEQFSTEHKKAKEERAKWEAEYLARIEECRKDQEKLNCKIKQVLQRITKEKHEPALIQIVYKTIKKCQEEEQKRYDNFIGKISKKEKEIAARREEKVKEKVLQDRKKIMSTVEFNKTLAEYVRQRQCSNKCFCDRQCLIVKSDKEHTKNKGKYAIELERKEARQPYFGPRNKLVAALRRREKEPSPFTGANAAHQLFVKNAGDMLRDCKYKIPGRKVVDEYRKYNGLDATTLPVPNYY